jgi:hypothetical protein
MDLAAVFQHFSVLSLEESMLLQRPFPSPADEQILRQLAEQMVPLLSKMSFLLHELVILKFKK